MESQKLETGLFTKAWSDRIRCNGFKLKEGFRLDIRQKFFLVRLPVGSWGAACWFWLEEISHRACWGPLDKCNAGNLGSEWGREAWGWCWREGPLSSVLPQILLLGGAGIT